MLLSFNYPWFPAHSYRVGLPLPLSGFEQADGIQCTYVLAKLSDHPLGLVERKPIPKWKYTKYTDRLLPISTVHLNQYLSDEWDFLKQNLCRVLASGDILCDLPSILDSITRYVQTNGSRFSPSEHAALLRLSLSLVCCPNVDFAVCSTALSLAGALVKRPWNTPVKLVELNWSQFHDLVQWLTASEEASLGMLPWSKRDLGSLVELIGVVKRYFPPSSIEELWTRYRHHVLERMLHSFERHAFDDLRLFTPIYPKYFDTISRTWLPDVIDLWYLIPDFGPRFQDVVHLFSVLARNCRGHVNWEPHLERIFCGLFRNITLPNGPVSMADVRVASRPPVFNHYACLLVNAIGPDLPGSRSSVIARLKGFYQAAEPFYHPSNPSAVTTLLITFTHGLAWNLFQRLKSELLPSREQIHIFGLPPSQFNLTVEQVNEMVSLLASVTMDYMLFCKLNRNLTTVVQTIDILARLRPRLVLPKLLACLEDGLSRPEAPLRYTRPLHALALCVASFSHVRFPVFSQVLAAGCNDFDFCGPDDGDVGEYLDELDEFDCVLDDPGTPTSIEGNSPTRLLSQPRSPNRKNMPDSPRRRLSIPTPDKAHLDALLYPEGRAELNRILHLLLTGFDPNHTDRFNLTIACLSRLFLSMPVQDFTDPPMDSYVKGTDDDNGLDNIEETVIEVFTRILEHLQALNDRSYMAQNLGSGGSSAQTTSSDGRVVQRPHAGPEGRPRAPGDTATLSNLAALTVTIAISAGPNPHFRCKLLRLLVEDIFVAQWETDTARLFAYQLFWLAVNSKPSIAAITQSDDAGIPPLDTALFALDLIWARFLNLVDELSADQCMVYRGRVEPRLLAFLYILPGPLSALHPSRLVEPGFHKRYLLPLLALLSKLLYLSTGGAVTTADVGLISSPSCSSEHFCASPALAEASSSLLAVILRRLTAHSIDLSNLDLMQTGSFSTCPEMLFATSLWWSPFVSARTLFNRCKPLRLSTDANDVASSPTVPTFWVTPTEERSSLARQLIRMFLAPVLHRLNQISRELSSVRNISHFHGFEPDLPVAYQRDQLGALIIWTNNILTGLADDLAPRPPDVESSTVTALSGDNSQSSLVDCIPLLNLSLFECNLDNNGKPTGLRELIFDAGLRLLEAIASLFQETDDSLYGVQNGQSADTDNSANSNVNAQCTNASDTVGMLFTGSQIDDLLCFIHTCAFNYTSSEHYPCLLRTSRGPLSLCGTDLGAYTCIGAPPASHSAIVKVIPTMNDLCGPPCAESRHDYLFHTGCPSDAPSKGRFLLSWMATIQNRYLRLVASRLKNPLTFAGAGYRTSAGSPGQIMPTPAIRRLVMTMGVLCSAPRRNDIRLCVAGYLTSMTLPDIAEVTVDLVSSVIDRLENAVDDVEQQSALPDSRSDVVDGTAFSLSEAKFKLVTHRRLTALHLLAYIFHSIKSITQGDQLLRLNTSVVARMWIAVSAQAVHPPLTSKQNVVANSLSPTELLHRQTTQDQVERLVLNAFGRLSTFPMKFVLHPPVDRRLVPESSWLARVYKEVDNTLSTFSTSSFQIDNPMVISVVTKRRAVYQDFLAGLFNRCFSNYEALLVNTKATCKKGTAGQALIALLLRLLPRPIDPPSSLPWSVDSISLAPPPPSPPLALLTIALHLITSCQPDAAEAACNYIMDTLFLLLLRHRISPILELLPASIVKEHSGVAIPTCGPPIPAPRPDNAFLIFDEHACVLANETSYQKHHHIPSQSIGYIYYPPTIEIEDPHHVVPYPVFNSETGELEETQTDWLSYLNKSAPDEAGPTRSCLRLLANRLASPRKDTRDYWLLLADRLLSLHRRPNRRLFPIARFLQVCATSFGPYPLLHHMEAFFRALLSVHVDGVNRKFDGLTEIVGCVWLRQGLTGLLPAALRWPREWKHYFLARFLPRVLALAELNALSVSTSGLAQSMVGNVHPDLLCGLTLPLIYADNYGGAGNYFGDNQSNKVICSRRSSSNMSRRKLRNRQSVTVAPPTTISQSQAGGPMNRLAFVWDLLLFSISHNNEIDFSILHPLWEWTKCGILDCENEMKGISVSPTVNADSSGFTACSHTCQSVLSSAWLKDIMDECPICMLNHCLPLAHRRVFYARLCTTFITYMGWKGLKLFPHLSNCISSTTDSTNSHWFQKASDDSVWIRDLAATVAVFRAAIPHADIFHIPRAPLQTICYSPDTNQLCVCSSPSMTKVLMESERFVSEMLSRIHDTELIGAKFVENVFLPFLVRDTVTVLRLKGYQPSEASLALRMAEPESLPRTSSRPEGDQVTCELNDFTDERGTCVELRPLTNRLRCMYACLLTMLIHAFPVAVRLDDPKTFQMSNPPSLVQFCVQLSPLLADVCSTGNLYKRISHQLGMGAFSSAGFTRALIEGTGDEHLDGLESGVGLVLYRLSLIPLAGQNDPETAVNACLDLTHHFLKHSSWKTRGIGLLLLRNLVVMNLAAFWEMDQRSRAGQIAGNYNLLLQRLQQSVEDQLTDQWIEVCQLAMFTLAVLIQTGLLKFNDQWIAQLICRTKSPYRRRSHSQAKTAQELSDYHNAIRERHAGVLGLAAFVYAHPHTTPNFLPEIITELAGHVHDPHPIEKTVRDTLSAYSRSHQDAWHQQRGMFTEAQLEEYLSVVSAAAYYV
ncbi:Proteasome activator complex subunit 4 [Paragonimus heterotremus]|uniref:Proteasome activator complex subunit 4 n=1 Tax=Paragonimus heterotremus TaxID=100268 RepID=A0A8J4SQP0_9TREM|nr:Proteasome activator complex subunit 4 [Paragonimus heterotremus]